MTDITKSVERLKEQAEASYGGGYDRHGVRYIDVAAEDLRALLAEYERLLLADHTVVSEALSRALEALDWVDTAPIAYQDEEMWTAVAMARSRARRVLNSGG